MNDLAYTSMHVAHEAKLIPQKVLPSQRWGLSTLALLLSLFLPVSPAQANNCCCECNPREVAVTTAQSTPQPRVQLVSVWQPIVPSDLKTTELQNHLKALGYFPSGVASSGYYGPITKKSVRNFQADHGLKVDGVAGSITVATLKEEIAKLEGDDSTPVPTTTPLKKGDFSAQIRRAKARLNQFGYTAGDPQGFGGDVFDDRMEQALKRFQADKGLKVDGRIGPQTHQILYAFELGLPTLKLGHTGHLVQMVQYQLSMIPMGDFDERTAAMVKVFQAEKGLASTGVVDGATHKALSTQRARLSLAAGNK